MYCRLQNNVKQETMLVSYLIKICRMLVYYTKKKENQKISRIALNSFLLLNLL